MLFDFENLFEPRAVGFGLVVGVEQAVDLLMSIAKYYAPRKTKGDIRAHELSIAKYYARAAKDDIIQLGDRAGKFFHSPVVVDAPRGGARRLSQILIGVVRANRLVERVVGVRGNQYLRQPARAAARRVHPAATAQTSRRSACTRAAAS